MTTESMTPSEQVNPALKLTLELGPLIVFFLSNYKFGIFIATGSFMVATVVSLTLSKMLLGKIAIMPLVTGFFVLIFGAVIGVRGLIGRRCPKCDGPLKEVDAEQAKNDAFVMYINWRCPRDGYSEKEKTKGSSGLFGVD